MINLKKEFIIFSVLFIVFSFLMHKDMWLSMPLDHLSNLSHHTMPYHPLLYVFLIYLIIAILRGLFKLVRKLFTRK